MCTHDNNKTRHVKIFPVYQPLVSSNMPPINVRFFALGSVLKVSSLLSIALPIMTYRPTL